MVFSEIQCRSQESPWFLIWFQPRRAIRAALKNPSIVIVLSLAVVSGVIQFFVKIAEKNASFVVVDYGVLIFTVGAAAVWGIVGLFITAWLVGSIGRKLDGESTLRELCYAIAWSTLPQTALIVAALLVFCMFAVAAPDLTANMSHPGSLPSILFMAFYFTGTIWYIVVLLKTVSEIQYFSLSKSFLTVAFATLTIMSVAFLVRTLFYEPFSAASMSMAPALVKHDNFAVSKASYGYSRHSFPIQLSVSKGRWLGSLPTRGDVAVFVNSASSEKSVVISRIVGLPNDTVKLIAGVLHINGQAVPKERKGSFHLELPGGKSTALPMFVETLPNGVKYPVLDSELNGPFDTTESVIVPAGHYFVLGDNRDNSTDSRSTSVGLVSHDALIGRASLVFFSRRWDTFMKQVR